MHRINHLLAGLSLLLLDTSATHGAEAVPKEMKNAPLYAVGVYTADIHEALRQYQRILGVVPENFGFAVPIEPDGKKVVLEMFVVFFPNFYIKLQEPISDNGPYAEDLRRYGMCIQNFQFAVTGVPNVRADLLQKGGHWTLTYDPDIATYANFRKTLGTTLEITEGGGAPKQRVRVAPEATGSPLGSMPVTHVGIAVTDVRKAAKEYSRVFGIPEPVVEERRKLDYPPGARWNPDGHLRIARWQQGEIGVELVESMGKPTPWSDFSKQRRGNAAYSVAFDVGDRFDEIKRDLLNKGGRWIYGKAGGNEAHFDFTATLGLVIEIAGTPGSTATTGVQGETMRPTR